MWVVFALLTSFFNAAYFLLNQKMAMKASLFMVYRGWAVFFMLLPFAGLFTPVPHWEFYALCMLQGALIAFVDGKFFVALRRWGAEVATSLQPFSIGITFVLWLIISPSTILVYLREPLVALLIVAAMAGIVISGVEVFGSDTDRRRFLRHCEQKGNELRARGFGFDQLFLRFADSFGGRSD